MTKEYCIETYITKWKYKDNVIISLWHCKDFDNDIREQVGVVELAVSKHSEHKGEAFVWNLYVDENHRGKGLSMKLMNEAHKTAKHLRAKYTALEWSLKESPYWVKELYFRLGYDEEKIDNDYVLMKREIK